MPAKATYILMLFHCSILLFFAIFYFFILILYYFHMRIIWFCSECFFLSSTGYLVRSSVSWFMYMCVLWARERIIMHSMYATALCSEKKFFSHFVKYLETPRKNKHNKIILRNACREHNSIWNNYFRYFFRITQSNRTFFFHTKKKQRQEVEIYFIFRSLRRCVLNEKHELCVQMLINPHSSEWYGTARGYLSWALCVKSHNEYHVYLNVCVAS